MVVGEVLPVDGHNLLLFAFPSFRYRKWLSMNLFSSILASVYLDQSILVTTKLMHMYCS